MYTLEETEAINYIQTNTFDNVISKHLKEKKPEMGLFFSAKNRYEIFRFTFFVYSQTESNISKWNDLGYSTTIICTDII